MIANHIVRERVNAAFRMVQGLDHLRNPILMGSALYLPEPNDIDIGALLVPGVSLANYTLALKEQGWEVGGGYSGAGPTWRSFYKAGVNLLVMTDPGWLRKFELAMKVCEGLNLTDRKDRIIVCQIIRDGMDPDDAKLAAEKLTQKPNQSRS